MQITPVIRISVRPLVEYVYRSGSIVAGFRTASSMQEGTRIHQEIQRDYQPNDRKELHLNIELAQDGLLFQLEGRCDGLIWEDEQWTVDEIKSYSGDASSPGADGHKVHWAQAICYAYMVSVSEQLTAMQVQLTYVDVATGSVSRLKRKLSAAELEEQVRSILSVYVPYVRMLLAHEEQRNSSIRMLEFPFAQYREGQRRLAGAVYKTIEEGADLFVQAPTGIGKTMSTLFPAVKALVTEHASRIMYLTARTTTRAAAEDALRLMQSRGLRVHAVTITAKDKICFKEEQGCDAGQCSLCDGYYDRINHAVMDILEHETIMTREVLERYARKHRVCPFEFSLDVAYASDCIICDYNYVFDPRISLKRWLEEQKRQTILLVDEAHNLVDRSREMFSAELSKRPFLELKRAYKQRSGELATAASQVNNYFIKLRKELPSSGATTCGPLPQDLLVLLEPFVEAAERELLAKGAGGADEAHALLLESYFAVQNWLRIAGLYDERYVTYIEQDSSDVLLRLMCLDPSKLLERSIKSYRSAVYFSATLRPLAYYRELLGAGEEDYTLTVPSPFRQEQWDVRLLPVSTRYHARQRSIRPITELLTRLVQERKGNYLVFFPSYTYLREIALAFEQMGADAELLVQSSGMTEEERSAFLCRFQPDPPRSLIGMAVLGGVFSEGVDLPGERLHGVVVVGVGLPQVGEQRDVLKDYYQREGKNGFYYAYVYPGMNKVLQAGGRLIRTLQDYGLLVLVDDRFMQEPYASLLPEEWRTYRIISPSFGLDQSVERNSHEL
ncbi:ATP-dependent DNA helicase DinG [compost metagenome]